MSLKEKLAKIREQQNKTAATPAPAPKEEPKEKIPGDAIRQKLLELGAKKQVNPPPAITKTEEGETKKVTLSVNVEAAPKKSDKTLEVCPVCGESFKVLAKHRCKGKGETPPPPRAEEQHHDYILLIDCLPVGNIMKDVVSAESLTAETKKKICEMKKVEHWKLTEYGGGAALLQVGFEKFWYGSAFSGVILLSTSSLEFPAVVQTLSESASAVYRGV